ncbi:3236_t:CDS:2 [Ambispora gerdemannii]|uniref:3236_t:CDS:1 n=1 Tax=Ambispora gerdemannii TaxID=144530 RepID=A0A9N9EVL1_9GLOM|nr:3236_t:CDS:2 [Ambispora gerdemannii]
MENTFEITVQVNNDTRVVTKLPTAVNLTEIRKILSEKSEIRMGRKAYFCQAIEDSPIIPHDEEEKYFLENVIDSLKRLKLKGEIEPNWADIIERNSLKCGLFFTKNGPKSAEKKAFEILQYPKSTLQIPITSDQELNCRTEIDDIRAKNLFVTTSLDANLPYTPISAMLGGSYQSNSVNHSNNVNIKTYQKSIRIKAIFSMSESQIEPTKEFVSAVDVALVSTNRRESLEQVTKDFGKVWCKKLGIGGSILYVLKGESIVNESRMCDEINIGGGFGIGGTAGKGTETNQMNALTSEYSYFQIRGGLENYFHEQGMSGWIKSLDDYKTWEVVTYSDIHSIFDILDEGRRTKVATALGKRIIDSQVEKLDFRMDISKPYPHLYKIPKKYDLSNCQIFVTEMKDDNSDTIFASRVHYINDKESPVILLHRLGTLNKKLKYQKFSIRLGWIVLGTSTMLNLLEQNSTEPVFENGESLITVKNEHCSAIISSRKLNPNESLLASYVSRSKNLQENHQKSKYITRSHFIYNDKNDTIEACAFCYDLEKKQLLYQLGDLNTEFSINHSIIFGQQIDKYGQAQITSESRITLIQPKRYRILFDSYRDLTSQLGTQSCLQSPIFINLVLDKCPKNCPHGVFNITPNYAEFKYIDIDFFNMSLKNRQIAYFRAPIRIKDNDDDGRSDAMSL